MSMSSAGVRASIRRRLSSLDIPCKLEDVEATDPGDISSKVVFQVGVIVTVPGYIAERGDAEADALYIETAVESALKDVALSMNNAVRRIEGTLASNPAGN